MLGGERKKENSFLTSFSRLNRQNLWEEGGRVTCGKMQLNLAIKIENFNNLDSEKFNPGFYKVFQNMFWESLLRSIMLTMVISGIYGGLQYCTIIS